ncbi:MAG: MATE family efflux transporter [Planctomycetota bacterium]
MSTTKSISDATVERSPIVELLSVALPAVVTMTSYSLMQFVDRMFVSWIGPTELAGAGNGGIAAFVPGAVMMGVLGVVNTFVSQNLGANRPERGAAYAWNGLWLTVVAWALVMVPMAFVLPELFSGARSLLGDAAAVSEEQAALEVEYGRILLLGMVFMLAARGLSHYFYGMHRPAVVMVATIVGNIVNVIASYILIFGADGAPASFPGMGLDELPGTFGPALGVKGAAYGTVIGSFVELAIPMLVFLSAKYHREFKTRTAWRPNLQCLKDILRIGWPPGLMFGNELICWFVLMSVYSAAFGEIHNAVGWITLQYMHLSFMPAVGMSIALNAVVGKQMGRGRPDLAAARTWLGLRITLAYMGLCALCFVLFREPMIELFAGADYTEEELEELLRVGGWILLLAAGFQLFDGVAISLSGALRGAGDTVWPGIYTIVLSWACIVGGGKLFVEFKPEFGSVGPWIAASAFIIFLSLLLLHRFVSGAWKDIKLVDPVALDAARHMAADAGEGALPTAPALDVPDLTDDGAASGPVEDGPRSA